MIEVVRVIGDPLGSHPSNVESKLRISDSCGRVLPRTLNLCELLASRNCWFGFERGTILALLV